MEADEKTRRFRAHVVQELFDTEREYTAALEFTVNHIMAKTRLKAEHDDQLSKEIVDALFCNIQDLLSIHQGLVARLLESLGNELSYDSAIAQCYLQHRDQFAAYQVYGEKNEFAQKTLYDLEKKPNINAFFLGVLLLGGRSESSISTFVFKPIQRICKYPLLFKELLKYTPEGHSDRSSTEEALTMMRELCSVINEAKRRVEKLEAIADWQSSVEGWEGSPVVDTCNELVREGSLIKISAGNMQERMFFLFDNLMVYCKRQLSLSLRAKTEQKTLLFRGRIPVESLEIENIVDGTADYHTSGITVNNGWKVRNIAKNKWFVLVARSPADKQHWIEAFKVQKDRIKRAAAGLARGRRSLLLNKGSKLHCRLKQEGRLLQDHRYRLRSYPKSFTGCEFVQWLIEIGEAGDNNEAVRLGQGLVENGVIHHVGDKHQFKNNAFVYRFRYDDKTFHSKWETSDSLARGIRVYIRLHSLFDPLIKDHRAGLRTVKATISGSRLIDWLLAANDVGSRDEGVVLGSHFMAMGLLKHVTDEHKFKDTSSIFYRFSPDIVDEVKKISTGSGSPAVKADFCSIDTTSCVSLLVPYSDDHDGYGFTIEEDERKVVRVGAVSSTGPAGQAGMRPGQQVLWINGVDASQRKALDHCCKEMSQAQEHKTALEVYVQRDAAEECVLTPGSRPLGFQIKGNHPVVVVRVDKGSVAAEAGLNPGCCILKVEGENMVQASHDNVVKAIKSQLSGSQGDPSLKLKIGVGMVQQVARYQFESTDDTITQVVASCHDSSYLYILPALLFKLYMDEAVWCSKILSVKKVISDKVESYLTELNVLTESYKKIHASLSVPRYPSYRPFGAAPSSMMEAVPINLHTFGLNVIASAPFHTRSSFDSSSSHEGQGNRTEYSCTTMGVPSLMNRKLSATDISALRYCQMVRRMLSTLHNLEGDLARDHKLLQRLLQQQKPQNEEEEGAQSAAPVPEESPLLHQRGGTRGRERAVSIVNPDPVIKIVLDGVAKLLKNIRKLTEEGYLSELLQNTSDCVKDCSAQDLLTSWKKSIDACSDELALLPDGSRPVVSKFCDSLVANLKPIMKEIEFHLLLDIALHENLDTARSADCLFSQCLVAAVSAFAHQLQVAIKGQLNPFPDHNVSSKDVSQQWLSLIAEKGMLISFTGLLQTAATSESTQLQDLWIVLDQLKTVTFKVKELKDCSPSNSTLPTITLEGDHNELCVTFMVPFSALEILPEDVATGSAISLHPVLFNKGLVELSEVSDAYKWEQQLNDKSFIELRDYYRAVRQYHLNRTTQSDDEVERSLAVEQISQLLAAMDVLVHQLEVAIREPAEKGVGMLSLLSELVQKMGGVQVLTCGTGIHRCLAALTLEQVLQLIQSHGLPPRCFKSSLAGIRQDFVHYLEKRNSSSTGDRSQAFPQPPPWLYHLT